MTLKNLFAVFFVFISVVASGQSETVPAGKRLVTAAAVSLNSNGVASIPAFSLGKPAIVATVSLTKGRFSYDPGLAYGLDLRPWYIDNWLHYRIIDKPKFELRTGFNASTFFTRIESEGTTMLRGERYFAPELAMTWRPSTSSWFSLMYWNDRGQESTSMTGHFIDFTAEKSAIRLGSSLLSSVNMQLFYIDYDGNEDGLFISPRVSFYKEKLPFTLFVMGTQGLFSNIKPFPGLQINVGLSYTL